MPQRSRQRYQHASCTGCGPGCCTPSACIFKQGQAGIMPSPGIFIGFVSGFGEKSFMTAAAEVPKGGTRS